MRQRDFKVTFLSDIVLHASSNSEGNIETLDYITGSSFLGMVAKNYDKFEDPFNIFHSGKVRFGEARPLFENKTTYKVPFSFFSPKLDFEKQEIKNNHFIDYEDPKELDKQYKQIRSGYITSNLDYINLDYNYSQKSAYDKEQRRSKESSMFGYNAIKSGTIWKFTIKFDKSLDEKIEKQVLENILGEKYLGKSKTAQYGKILIEELKDFKEENLENLNPKEITYVYINSSLVLFNANGMPSFEPTIENLGLTNASICWEQTQIRTKKITPYNFKRQTNDYSRLIIEKGSVIALKNASNEDIEVLKSGIGGYLSEGYGEVLINPSFLLKKDTFALNKVKNRKIEQNIDETKIDKALLAFLSAKEDSKNANIDLSQRVQNFIVKNEDKFKNVSNSQWGQIRVLVQFDKDNYKDKIKEFITKGVSKTKWEQGQKVLSDIVDDEDIEFVKLLSMMMSKVK
ncbi:hypothetical protein CRU94_03895 [Arcobacter sp. AHV-9/2010]|uniref:hypothetical protein n=1 Tax=Arcobacter sp. AHV-9/2010 TaxID=2021861 RepID=UPI00100B9ED4|nr:hypothetical protein [Arcobacter sp. CECT 9299]RXJ95765.1 hypothetical protein CRU94_03895 [Arcobacter sp. CECT 9299]